ncbi:hypothetical protein NOR53_2909 [gamma proteobacterium NOR5-3]|nr:hypothetical protein NOR53_2909 [gamma proteobacterium NOR5-3]
MAIDSHGTEHSRIAHYTYAGWSAKGAHIDSDDKDIGGRT